MSLYNITSFSDLLSENCMLLPCESRRMKTSPKERLVYMCLCTLGVLFVVANASMKNTIYVLKTFLRFKCSIFLFLYIFFLKGTDVWNVKAVTENEVVSTEDVCWISRSSPAYVLGLFVQVLQHCASCSVGQHWAFKLMVHEGLLPSGRRKGSIYFRLPGKVF